jgi:hypothetical protein
MKWFNKSDTSKGRLYTARKGDQIRQKTQTGHKLTESGLQSTW